MEKTIFVTNAVTAVSTKDLEGVGALRWVNSQLYRWVQNKSTSALTMGQVAYHKPADAAAVTTLVYDLATSGATSASMMGGVVMATSLAANSFGWILTLGQFESVAMYASGGTSIAVGDYLKGNSGGGYAVHDRTAGSDVAQTQDTVTDSTGGVATTTLVALTNLSTITDSTGGSATTTFVTVTPQVTITDETGGAATSTFITVTPTATYNSADLVAILADVAQFAADANLLRTWQVAITNDIAQLAASSGVQLTFNESVKNDIASVTAQLAKVKTDVSGLVTAQGHNRNIVALEALDSAITIATAKRGFVRCV